MLLLGIVLVVTLAIVFGSSWFGNSTKYDSFAQCLTQQGAKMYGAWWCPHCLDQKDEFSSSWKHVTYVECSTSSRGQTPACQQAGIMSYPTWEFADGSRIEGTLTFHELSLKTGCALPQ